MNAILSEMKSFGAIHLLPAKWRVDRPAFTYGLRNMSVFDEAGRLAFRSNCLTPFFLSSGQLPSPFRGHFVTNYFLDGTRNRALAGCGSPIGKKDIPWNLISYEGLFEL